VILATGAGKTAERSAPRVLVVDDDVPCAVLLKELVERSGYAARAAHEGASGLAAVTNFDPHFVLLDVRMPGLDGAEFVRHLRANEGPHSRRVIIVCTGLPLSDVQGLNADRYLPKPIDMPALLSMLELEWRTRFAETPWCR
jgi:CheY-like chemotaxis protein